MLKYYIYLQSILVVLELLYLDSELATGRFEQDSEDMNECMLTR